MMRWPRRLKRLHLHAFRFAGGRPLSVGNEPDEGIQFLAKDFVAIRRHDLLYLIPYRALRLARGRYRFAPNRRRFVDLQQEVTSWVDPHSTLWHYFITRRGRELRGALLAVNSGGIVLRHNHHLHRLPWRCLAAAVEILE